MANQNVVATVTHFFTRHGHTKESGNESVPLVLDDTGKEYAQRLIDEVPANPNQQIIIYSDDVDWAINTVQPLADAQGVSVNAMSTQDLYDKAVEIFIQEPFKANPDPLDNRLYVWCMRRRENEPNGLWKFYQDYIYPTLIGQKKDLGDSLSSAQAYNHNWWGFQPYVFRGSKKGYENYQTITYQRSTHQNISENSSNID